MKENKISMYLPLIHFFEAFFFINLSRRNSSLLDIFLGASFHINYQANLELNIFTHTHTPLVQTFYR